MSELKELESIIREFAEARDWSQFHSPKNLSMALAVEAAELLEHFQWLTAEESNNLSAEKVRAVSHEIADVMVYLIRLADLLGVNIKEAMIEKIQINEAKYPVDRVHGSAKKYTEYP